MPQHACHNGAMTSIWAHRGASRRAPENTLPAFELAIELGADGVELDVQRTADGELVVIHDETVDRTTNGTGAVAALTSDEVRALDASAGLPGFGGTRVPTLLQVLELLRGTELQVNVELKTSIQRYPGIEREALALVDELGMREQVVWSSFRHGCVASMVGDVPAGQLALLMSDVLVRPWEYAVGLGVGAIHPGLHMLQEPDLVARAHECGLQVRTWTVDEPEHLQLAARAGVDAIITNVPDVARSLLD